MMMMMIRVDPGFAKGARTMARAEHQPVREVGGVQRAEPLVCVRSGGMAKPPEVHSLLSVFLQNRGQKLSS